MYMYSTCVCMYMYSTCVQIGEPRLAWATALASSSARDAYAVVRVGGGDPRAVRAVRAVAPEVGARVVPEIVTG